MPDFDPPNVDEQKMKFLGNSAVARYLSWQSTDSDFFTPSIRFDQETFDAWVALENYLRIFMANHKHLHRVDEFISSNRGTYIYPPHIYETVGVRSGQLFIIDDTKMTDTELQNILQAYEKRRAAMKSNLTRLAIQQLGDEDEINAVGQRLCAPLTYIDRRGIQRQMVDFKHYDADDISDATPISEIHLDSFKCVEQINPVFRMMFDKESPYDFDGVREVYQQAVALYAEKAAASERESRKRSLDETTEQLRKITADAQKVYKTVDDANFKKPLLVMGKNSHGFHFSIKMFREDPVSGKIKKHSERFTIPRACFIRVSDFKEMTTRRKDGLYNYMQPNKAPESQITQGHYFCVGQVRTPNDAKIHGVKQFFIFAHTDDTSDDDKRNTLKKIPFVQQSWLKYTFDYYHDIVEYPDERDARLKAIHTKLDELNNPPLPEGLNRPYPRATHALHSEIRNPNWVFCSGGREHYFKGRKGAGDCVTRAISIAMGADYKWVYDSLAALNKAAGYKKSARNGVHDAIWEKFVMEHGWEKHPYPRIEGRKTYAPDFKGMGTLLVRTRRHLACVKDGVVWDSWDSSVRPVVLHYYKLPDK